MNDPIENRQLPADVRDVAQGHNECYVVIHSKHPWSQMASFLDKARG